MYLFKLWFSPDICLGVGLLDHMVVLFLVFEGTSILFSIAVVPVYIPTNSVEGFRLANVFKPPFCLGEKLEESKKTPLEVVCFELI